MLEALYQNWMRDPTKRKWLLTYIPFLLSFLLILFIAWQLAKLFWFFKAPLGTDAKNPIANITPNANANPLDSRAPSNLNTIKNANLFGVYQETPSNTVVEETVDAPETKLNLTLNGTLVSTNAEDSLAIIRKDNDDKVYRVGDELQANVSVLSIHAAQVVINNRGKRELLNLPKEMGTNATNANYRALTPRRPISGSANRVARQLKEKALKNPSKLTDIIRLKKGKLSSGVQGFRIYPGKERQTFNELGLKPGDFITAVNGLPIADQNPFQLFQTLNSAPYINLSIERNGNPTNISFDLAQTKK